MNILGLSSDFHDSSAALLQSGRPIFSAAEERFSCQKHDSSFPSLAIDACLTHGALQAHELDWVAYHEDPVVKFSRVLASKLCDFPRGFSAFARSMRELILGQLWIKLDIYKKVGINPRRVRYVPHHLSHAAYAFATSPFESSIVLVLDAVGEWSSTTFFRGRRKGGSFELIPLGLVPYPHSLGMFYSAFTAFLGFRVNEGECSLMALAAFGRPRFLDSVRQIVRPQADGTYELDLSFFDFSDPERLPLSPKFFALFGAPRSFREPLPFSSQLDASAIESVGEEARRFADLAASVQAVLEETVLALCAKLRGEGEENLCLAGGVALNSTMNGRLLRESGFRQVHIPPDPGDGGGALGAAYYLQSQLGEVERSPHFSPYLGREYGEESVLRLLPKVSQLQGLEVERFQPGDTGPLVNSVAGDLAMGKIVGWLQGRFENGPRALGNRSILADPRHAGAAARLSHGVKARAAFRPYACSVLADNSNRLFEASAGMSWMGATQKVKEEARSHLPQALHIDGTTRPQILAKSQNPRFHQLLEAWESASGCPALLNTSFNESGYPMVSSPVEALLMFCRTEMETLVLNSVILRKRRL